MRNIFSAIFGAIREIFRIIGALLPRERGNRLILYFIIFLAIFAGLGLQILTQLPNVEAISIYSPSQTTEIYAADGSLLTKLHREENRYIVPLEKISPILQKALIAVEDERFYQHRGIDIIGILRAAYTNISKRRVEEGGSTITQQLARNLFLSRKRTITRKIAEMILAMQIERKYTKNEILELYLNQVYWGHNTYGIESASQTYFNKHAKDMNLAESTLLAGIIEGPELFSPLRNMEGAKKRQAHVISKMVELGMIEASTANAALQEEIKLSEQKPNRYRFAHPYFTSYVIHQLIERYGEYTVYNGGLRVYTTVDPRMQKIARNVISKFHKEEGETYNFSQAALASVDPRTGYIKALAGGVSFEASEFNRAWQAQRQPGSSFKAFTYTTAMELGISPGFVLEDSPATYEVPATEWNPEGIWEPQNFDEKFRGKVTVRMALEKSLNIPSVRLLEKVGVGNVINVAKRMGIKSPMKRSLGLTLGVSEVSLLEMASAFSVFANGGIRVEPTAITRIEGRNGQLIYKHVISEKRVLDKNIAAVMVDIMGGVLLRGTGVRGKIDRPAGAKTGTTEEFKDAWFIGYVPQLCTGVWVGNDNNEPMEGVTEVAVCPRMWKAFMNIVLMDKPIIDFPKPEGLVEETICLESSRIPNEYCPGDRIVKEKFWWDDRPTDICTYHPTTEAPPEYITRD
ncbi:transglycosylase domain-containing protein [Candidatus Margulisiibacteriota bacterium]